MGQTNTKKPFCELLRQWPGISTEITVMIQVPNLFYQKYRFCLFSTRTWGRNDALSPFFTTSPSPPPNYTRSCDFVLMPPVGCTGLPWYFFFRTMWHPGVNQVASSSPPHSHTADAHNPPPPVSCFGSWPSGGWPSCWTRTAPVPPPPCGPPRAPATSTLGEKLMGENIRSKQGGTKILLFICICSEPH